MKDQARVEPSVSLIACFPSRSVREEFLQQVRLWNLLHELPPIETGVLADGGEVRVRSASPSALRLVEAFGGRVIGGD